MFYNSYLLIESDITWQIILAVPFPPLSLTFFPFPSLFFSFLFASLEVSPLLEQPTILCTIFNIVCGVYGSLLEMRIKAGIRPPHCLQCAVVG